MPYLAHMENVRLPFENGASSCYASRPELSPLDFGERLYMQLNLVEISLALHSTLLAAHCPLLAAHRALLAAHRAALPLHCPLLAAHRAALPAHRSARAAARL